jgi:hypothetical protein
MTGGVPLVLAVVGALLLAATARQAGRLWLRRRVAVGEPLGEAMAVALGLALLAQVGLALAFVGALQPPLLALLVLAVHAATWREWRPLGIALAVARRRCTGWAVVVGAGTIGAVLLMSVYPAAAFDETVYHLPMARAFAESGGLPVLPQLRFPVFPALAEVLQAELWLFGGELASHAVAAVAVLATAGLLLAARRGAPGWVAAAAWVGSPIVVYVAGTGYLEPLLALWSLGALVAVGRWRAGGDAIWCQVAAVFAGCAAATKYLGLLTLAFVGVEVLAVSWRRHRRELVAFCALAALAAAPTYLRNFVLTGNPLFPFYSGIFGSSAWDADSFLGARGGARWRAVATSLWDVVARRERTGHLPPFTPLLPLLALVAAWGALTARGARRCALFAFTFLALAPVNAHYLVAALPTLAVAAGRAVADLAGTGRRRLVAAVAVVIALPGPLYAASWAWRFGAPPTSAAAREHYLTERLPLYGSLRALERRSGHRYTAYALGGEQLKYHARGRLLGEINGPTAYERVLAASPQPAELRRTLAGLGAAYLILAEELAPHVGAGGGEWGLHFELLHADGRGRLYGLRS